MQLLFINLPVCPCCSGRRVTNKLITSCEGAVIGLVDGFVYLRLNRVCVCACVRACMRACVCNLVVAALGKCC